MTDCLHRNIHFDRTLCVCDAMHNYCDDCGACVDECPYAPDTDPKLIPPLQEAHPALVARAWHDITCPEGPDCRDRLVHSAAQMLANTGLLTRFMERLAELHAEGIANGLR